MFPLMNSPRRPAAKEEIAQFEGEFKVKLPELYRQFILEVNGGVPTSDFCSFPVPSYNLDTRADINVFYGIGADLWTSDLLQTNRFYFGQIPSELVLIADDDIANFLALDLRNGQERVVYWDQTHFWGTGEWREEDLYHVAASFDEFLGLLRPAKRYDD